MTFKKIFTWIFYVNSAFFLISALTYAFTEASPFQFNVLMGIATMMFGFHALISKEKESK